MSTKSPCTPVVRLRRKVCAIFPGALGDFICFLPALQALSRTAAVDVFARTEFGEIGPPDVVIRSIERPEIGGLFRTGSLDDVQVRKFFDGYDSIYSWLGSRNSDFVTRLKVMSGARARVFPFLPEPTRCHQTDHYLRCLNLGTEAGTRPAIALRADAVRWADGFWAQHRLQSRPVLAIAPGSGARAKNWPVEFFHAVSLWWQKAVAGAVVFLIGPVEEERGMADALVSAGMVARGLSLSQTAALLARSRVYLGNDSGVSHLAGALDIRAMVLFGPSDPRRWAPRGAKVVLLHRGIVCSPCAELSAKSCRHRACLNELRPEEVVARLVQLPEVVTLTR